MSGEKKNRNLSERFNFQEFTYLQKYRNVFTSAVPYTNSNISLNKRTKGKGLLHNSELSTSVKFQ